ncbi:MAG: threonine ammonia-lyase [Gemmatimonadaceae bacterium]
MAATSQPAAESRLSHERIALAASTIDPVFLASPQYHAEPLDRLTGARVVVKVETINPIRSFKGRGAEFFVGSLKGHPVNPLVCASAGNFGQGLAYSTRKRDIPLTVFAAENANPLKVQRMRELGATVILAGEDFDAAKEAARAHAGRTGTRFVEDGREVEIAEGAGTIAVELLRRGPAFDALLVPLGDGALATGIGAWIKHRAPSTQVIAVAARGAPALERSWRAGAVVTTDQANTIADGIAGREPVPEVIGDLRATVDDVLLVDDETLIRAMRLVFESLGLIVEPAGIAGMAALLEYPERFRGAYIATPLCGGNVTAEQGARWLWGGGAR